MFKYNCSLPFHILVFPNIMISHFCGKIFCLEKDSREEIGKGTILMNSEFFFHSFGTISTKEDSITLTSDTSNSDSINTSFIRQTCELLLCLSKFFSYQYSLMIKYLFLNELLFASLDRKICLSKCDLLFARITILSNKISSISCKVKIYTRPTSSTF